MSVEQNKAIVRRFFQEVLLDGKPGGDMFAADYRNHVMGQSLDAEAAEAVMAQFRAGIANPYHHIQEQIGEGELVATRYVFGGTHQGGFPPGIPATGRHLAVPGIAIHRVRAGKIVEDWPGFDSLIMLTQLGVIPMPEGASPEVPESRGSTGETTQSRDELVALLERGYREMLSEGKTELVDELLAEDYVDSSPSHPPEFSRDREGLKQLITAWRTTFPDWRITIDEIIVEGDNAVVCCTNTGTHHGPFPGMDLPPTGKQARWDSVELVRGRNGKGIEHYAIPDQVGLLQQLGVIPAPEAASR